MSDLGVGEAPDVGLDRGAGDDLDHAFVQAVRALLEVHRLRQRGAERALAIEDAKRRERGERLAGERRDAAPEVVHIGNADGGRERRRPLRSAPEVAIEDDMLDVAQRADAILERHERQVQRAGEVDVLVLLRLAHVDEHVLGLVVVLSKGAELVRGDVGHTVGVTHHGSSPPG